VKAALTYDSGAGPPGKNAEKNAWIIDRERLRFGYGMTQVQLTPHRRLGARLGEVGTNEMDTDIDMRYRRFFYR